MSSSFEIDEECRAACERARRRIHIAPLPAIEPVRRADLDPAVWAMSGVLAACIVLLVWRMPEVMAVLS